MKPNRYQAVLLAAVLMLAGCTDSGVIPRKKMVAILHDMYLVDAQVVVDGTYKAMADTTSVYGALLAEYGYDQDDFNRSLDYYLQRPVQFKELFNAVHERLKEEAGAAITEINPAGTLLPEDLQSGEQPPKGRARRQRKARESTDAEPKE